MKYTIIITGLAILLATLTYGREPVERTNPPEHYSEETPTVEIKS